MKGHRNFAGLEGEYSAASRLMESADRLRRSWVSMHPHTELKRGDMMLISHLLEREQQGRQPPTLGQLAKMLRQTPPGITQKVNALEEQGLVQRLTDPGDRRVACVQLTEKGRQVGRQAMRAFLQGMEQALDSMGKERGEQLVVLMNQLCDAIETVAAPAANTNTSKGVEDCC